jgi:hypothetical protein
VEITIQREANQRFILSVRPNELDEQLYIGPHLCN